MQTVISLLRKVPQALRFLLLVVIAFISFYLGWNGLTEGIVWQWAIGVPLFLFVAYTFYYMITNKTQL